MTRNEMIKAAHAAGAALENYGGAWHVEMGEVALKKYTDMIIGIEREECAKACERFKLDIAADAIRKRGEPHESSAT